MSAIEKGVLCPMEEQADNFAVMQSGKEAMIGFLEFLLRTCPTGGKLGWNEIGNRELQIRIAEQSVTKKARVTMISFFRPSARKRETEKTSWHCHCAP